MKKIVLFSSMLCMAALFGATGTFAPVWGDKATYSNDLAALATPDKVFPQTIDGKKYLKVMRGGLWHTVQFLEPLKADDNYSYSFTVLRSQENSAFMSVICAEIGKPGIGSVFINSQGTVYAINEKGQWKATPFIIRPNREYKINVSVFNSAKTYRISVDGAGEFEIASVYREGADKLVFAPQPPDKNVSYVGELSFTLNPVNIKPVAKVAFAPVWGDKATYSNDFAAMELPEKIFPQIVDSKKYLKVMRGGTWHKAILKNPLKADDSYSYSFTVRRNQADSAFMSVVCAELSKPGIGSVFINSHGTVYAMNDKGQWKATPFIIRPDREYKINVSVSNSAKTYKVSVDGAGEFEIASVYRENADKIVFAPQPPDKNVNYIGDFKIYFGK